MTVYRQRIQRALEYIAANLHRPIRLSTITCSRSHTNKRFSHLAVAMSDCSHGPN